MHRKFIATVVATSILITGLAAVPARANQDDLGKALAAIVGLAIVGKVIHENKKSRREQAHVQQPQRHKVQKPRYDAKQPVRKQQHIQKQRHVQKPRHIQPRPLPHRISRNLLPGQCLRSFETHRGTARIFGQRCLERNYGFTHRLPQHCERRIRTDRGTRFGFGARCLRKQGYQLARR